MPINISYLTGPAGSGKSYTIRKRIEDQEAARKQYSDQAYGKTCATTGVAAMNLGTVTLHSLLKFFKPTDLHQVKTRMRIYQKLDELNAERFIIDEASMLGSVMLQEIVDLLDEYGNMDLLLSGDFAQLPPVNEPFCFESPIWNRVEVEKLTKIHRQDNPKFLEALNYARMGNGVLAARILKDLCEFKEVRDANYPGVCIVATRNEAQTMNTQCLERLEGDYITMKTTRWGKQLNEWRDIPDMVSLKVGCRVRIRANETQDFSYVNGDTGVLLGINDLDDFDDLLGRSSPLPDQVRLDRNNQSVTVNQVTRFNDIEDHEVDDYEESQVKWRKIYRKGGEEDNIPYIGSIRFLPIEPGYATTTHSCQGLTLDSAQVSLAGLTSWQFNRGWGHNLAYVALSRVRTPERLRIHGTPQGLGAKIKIDPRVNNWI